MARYKRPDNNEFRDRGPHSLGAPNHATNRSGRPAAHAQNFWACPLRCPNLFGAPKTVGPPILKLAISAFCCVLTNARLALGDAKTGVYPLCAGSRHEPRLVFCLGRVGIPQTLTSWVGPVFYRWYCLAWDVANLHMFDQI